MKDRKRYEKWRGNRTLEKSKRAEPRQKSKVAFL